MNITVDPKDLDRILAKIDRIRPMKRDGVLYKAFERATGKVASALRMNLSNRIMRRRTGQLANSIQNVVKMGPVGIEGTIGSGVRTGKRLPYANIHETGKPLIRPKNKKFLTIPTKYNQTRAGVMRKSAPRVIDEDGGFFKRSKSGNLMLFAKQGKEIIPMFVLKTVVRIPARRYLSITASQNEKQFTADIEQAIEKELSR